MCPRPPISTLFPYTTLFRSHQGQPRRWQEHLPAVLAELAASLAGEDPDQIGGDAGKAAERDQPVDRRRQQVQDRKSTRLNSSHRCISYAVFCLKKKKNTRQN